MFILSSEMKNMQWVFDYTIAPHKTKATEATGSTWNELKIYAIILIKEFKNLR